MYLTEYEKSTVESSLTAFEAALSSGPEEDIQKFLERNTLFLDILRYDGFIRPKVRLADSYVPDFVTVASQRWSQRLEPLVTFVEIERANKSLFTKAGDPTAFLTHAIRQVQDWKRWVSENRTYLQTYLHKIIAAESPPGVADDSRDGLQYRRERIREGIAHGFKDRYLVVAGRRRSMTISERIRLTQMNDDLHDVRIITYDALIEDVLRTLEYLGRSGEILWAEERG